MGNKQVKLAFDREDSQSHWSDTSRQSSGSALKVRFKDGSGRGLWSPRSNKEGSNSKRGGKSPFRSGARSEPGTDAGSIVGTGGEVMEVSADALSSFVLAAGSFIHAVQAERGGSCIYCSSGGNKLSNSLKLMRAVSDEMLARLTQTSMFSTVREMFTWGEMDILRLRVDSLMPFTECYYMYTVMVQQLLEMMSTGLESLRHTNVGSSVATYTLFMTYKEYVGRERAFCGGIISGGGKFQSEKQYHSLVGLKASQAALSRTFVLTASKGTSALYTHEVAVLPEVLEEFSTKIMESQEDAEGAMQEVTPEWWFDAMTMRMDVMEAVQGHIVGELHGQMGVNPKDKLLSAPLLPDLERSFEDEDLKHRERGVSGRRESVEDPDYGTSFVLVADSRDLSNNIRIDLTRKVRTSIGGTIYKGIIPHGRQCSVKVCEVSSSGPGDTELIREFIRELSAVSVMRHPNVVKLLGASLKPPKYAMVLEDMDDGSLWDKLRTDPTAIDFLSFAIQLASGVQHIHEVAGLMHRNLKSPNLLLNRNGQLKISQLGLSCLGEEGQTGQKMEIGTLRWMAPEVLLHRPYGQSADIFSVGVILWELLTKQIPFEGLHSAGGKLEKPSMVKVAKEGLRMKWPPHTPKPIRKLLLACWNPDPWKRPKIDSVKKTLEDFAAAATDAQKEFLNQVHPSAGMANHQFLLQQS